MRLKGVAVLAVAATLALSACGGGGKPGGGSSSTGAGAPASSSTPPPPPVWPLTGLPSTDGAAETHHVLIAKVDNTEASQPQYGFSHADFITEELVEGGITRLAVFFYSELPSKVGPIRSMRATDATIAKPVDGRLIASGAASYTYGQLGQAHVNYYTMSSGYVKRDYDGSHDYLHSVIANLKGLGASEKIPATRPNDYFTWGTEDSFTGTTQATKVSLRFSGYRTDHFTYAGGKYTLTNGYMNKGDVYYPDTIIAAMVTTSIAPYKDPAGNPVPVSKFDGSGKAYIYHAGKVEAATWTKASIGSQVTFKDATTGQAIDIPAGHVFLGLVPVSGGSALPKPAPPVTSTPTTSASN